MLALSRLGSSGEIRSPGVVDLQQLHWRATNLDERHGNPGARAVRFDENPLTFERHREIINLEGHVGNGLDQIGIVSVWFVPLPLHTNWVVLLVAHNDPEVRQRDLAREPIAGRDPDVIEAPTPVYDGCSHAVKPVTYGQPDSGRSEGDLGSASTTHRRVSRSRR